MPLVQKNPYSDAAPWGLVSCYTHYFKASFSPGESSFRLLKQGGTWPPKPALLIADCRTEVHYLFSLSLSPSLIWAVSIWIRIFLILDNDKISLLAPKNQYYPEERKQRLPEKVSASIPIIWSQLFGEHESTGWMKLGTFHSKHHGTYSLG